MPTERLLRIRCIACGAVLPADNVGLYCWECAHKQEESPFEQEFERIFRDLGGEG
jgi:hypothetical protein